LFLSFIYPRNQCHALHLERGLYIDVWSPSVRGNMSTHATSFIGNMSTFLLVVGGIGRANTYHLSTGEYALSTPKLYHLSALSSTIL